MVDQGLAGPREDASFGLYDQLMIELRREDQRAYINLTRMSPDMFDKILARWAQE
ncbi:hypothetical protein DPMN_042235 [Dreissena polymorpha]|uniref:Uncharacterized protein n=1 Tax=Dreissena polymorpha TaxID=45954 RepID=A0A9D4HUL7_DREPO|nr:hypothetical protein DPMN_042235 [Dreissena polymorpha]